MIDEYCSAREIMRNCQLELQEDIEKDWYYFENTKGYGGFGIASDKR
jgi:uncharacterized protein YegJ (DUF2314 family)